MMIKRRAVPKGKPRDGRDASTCGGGLSIMRWWCGSHSHVREEEMEEKRRRGLSEVKVKRVAVYKEEEWKGGKLKLVTQEWSHLQSCPQYGMIVGTTFVGLLFRFLFGGCYKNITRFSEVSRDAPIMYCIFFFFLFLFPISFLKTNDIFVLKLIKLYKLPN